MLYELIKKILYSRVPTISVLFSINMLSFLRKDTTNINSSWLSLSSVFTRNATMLLFLIFISTFKSSAKFSNK